MVENFYSQFLSRHVELKIITLRIFEKYFDVPLKFLYKQYKFIMD